MRSRFALIVVSAASAAVAASAAFTTPSSAAPPAARHFMAQPLNGSEEVPPRETSAHGLANFHLNKGGTELRFRVVAHIDNLVGGHVHAAPVGVNGPIVLELLSGTPGGGRVNGVVAKGTVVRGVTPLPDSLGATLTDAERFDALVALMRSGDSYVNLHTNDGVDPTDEGPGDFPGGEIRAQIVGNP